MYAILPLASHQSFLQAIVDKRSITSRSKALLLVQLQALTSIRDLPDRGRSSEGNTLPQHHESLGHFCPVKAIKKQYIIPNRRVHKSRQHLLHKAQLSYPLTQPPSNLFSFPSTLPSGQLSRFHCHPFRNNTNNTQSPISTMSRRQSHYQVTLSPNPARTRSQSNQPYYRGTPKRTPISNP